MNSSHIYQYHGILFKISVTAAYPMFFIHVICKLRFSLKSIQDTQYTLKTKIILIKILRAIIIIQKLFFQVKFNFNMFWSMTFCKKSAWKPSELLFEQYLIFHEVFYIYKQISSICCWWKLALNLFLHIIYIYMFFWIENFFIF